MKSMCIAVVAVALLIALPLLAQAAAPPHVATFSVVAYDPNTGEVGVAVQSKFFAVGSVVPWCKAGVGAVATQAFAQPDYGPDGLAAMEKNYSPLLAIATVLAEDEKAAQRQLGMVIDSKFATAMKAERSYLIGWDLDHLDQGNLENNLDSVSYTGNECLDWAGGIARTAPDGVVYAVQGNILTGPEVVEAMAGFMDNPGDILVPEVRNEPSNEALVEILKAIGPDDFAGRLLGAMVAGQMAGGDSRGMQSAALKVCQAGAGYGGYTDVKYDLRVDDALDPFMELARLLNLARPIQLTFAGYRELEAGNIDEAIRIFTQLADFDPRDASHRYNLACGLARAGRADEALEQLRVALELDAKLKDLAGKDSDLESLREREEFKELVGEAGP